MKIAQLAKSPWVFLPVIALGIFIATSINKSQPEIAHNQDITPVTKANYIELKSQLIRPKVKAYGEIKPDTLLTLSSEVSGRVMYLDPELKEGALLPKGHLIAKLDAVDYELAIKQAHAQVSQSQSQLSEIKLNQKASKIDLELALQSHQLAKKELQRNTRLIEKKSISQTSYETSRSNEIQKRQDVERLKAELANYPNQIALQQAQIEITQADLESQQRNLERTEIYLPFAARISRVDIETGSYMSLGASLVQIQGIEKVEINAALAMRQFISLINPKDMQPFSPQGEFNQEQNAFKRLIEISQIRAEASIADRPNFIWPANLVRMDNNLDPKSRTLGVILNIDDPYKDLIPGIKPPLIEGMYMSVNLIGAEQTLIPVPRKLFHEGQLYFINLDNKLERIQIDGISQGDYILISPIYTNYKVVSSDLFPAIEGMRLAPNLDIETGMKIKTWIAEQ